MRLKTAAAPISYLTMAPCSNERDVMERVEREERVDIMFLSERLDPETLENLIQRVKNSEKGTECVFVVVKSSPDGGIPVSEALSLGADCILCEPFSVDNLAQVVELGNKIARDRKGRARLSATLLVTDILDQIDAAAFLMKSGHNPGILMKSARKLGERIHEIEDEDLGMYFEIVFKLINLKKPMNKELAAEIYRRASERSGSR